MTKDSIMKEYVCGDKHWLAAASVSISLCAMMLVARNHSGGVMNPAMSVSQAIFGESQDIDNEHFWITYMLCPTLGGLLAGVYSWAHRWMILNFDDAHLDAKKE